MGHVYHHGNHRGTAERLFGLIIQAYFQALSSPFLSYGPIQTCINGTLIMGLGPRALLAVDVKENYSCGKYSILNP